MSAELSEAQLAALPAWARRGLLPHRGQVDRFGWTCEECGQAWREGEGCEVVVVTRALADALLCHAGNG